jgi:hypothetical protein
LVTLLSDAAEAGNANIDDTNKAERSTDNNLFVFFIVIPPFFS